jgi:hypothetical protein
MAATKTRAAPPRPLTRRPTRAATIATTDAGGSIDRYALSLAAELGIPTLPLEGRGGELRDVHQSGN